MSAAPVSLYFDLEDGQIADMEVVARASLAFAMAVKELAAQIDPFLEIRIELASGTEGSLSLNSIVRNLRNHPGQSAALGAIIATVLTWFGGNLADYAFDKVMAELDGSAAQEEQFSPDQKKELEAMVQAASEKGYAAGRAAEVYREIEKDPAIKGVGATPIPGSRPAAIVPRSQFTERSTVLKEEVVNEGRRERTELIRVGLISPVLLEKSNRRWKFKSATGEFGAPIKDELFLKRVAEGTTAVRMRAGIEMDIELSVVEELRGGVWVPVERSVTKVGALHEPAPVETRSLFEGDPGQTDDGGHK